MIAEMRTYTVKDGMLETYLHLFNKLIVPNHKKYGIPILGAWLDKDKSQITWIRTFASREDRKNKLDIYEKSAERDAVFPIASYHMLKHDVKVLESVFNPSLEPDGLSSKARSPRRPTRPMTRSQSKRPRLSRLRPPHRGKHRSRPGLPFEAKAVHRHQRFVRLVQRRSRRKPSAHANCGGPLLRHSRLGTCLSSIQFGRDPVWHVRGDFSNSMRNRNNGPI